MILDLSSLAHHQKLESPIMLHLKYLCFVSLIVHLVSPCNSQPEESMMDDQDENKRVVGGSEIDDSSSSEGAGAPYALQLEKKVDGYWDFHCGGVIIGDDIVLTAGHCIEKELKENFRFKSGSTERGSGTTHAIVNMALHEDYEEKIAQAFNDILIAKVKPPFQSSKNARPISLASQDPDEGSTATVTGWGKEARNAPEYSMTLQEADINVVHRDECQSLYDKRTDIKIDDTMICGSKKGSGVCTGDDGGAFVIDNKLAGISSVTLGCGDVRYPGIFVNVPHYAPWIKYYMRRWS